MKCNYEKILEEIEKSIPEGEKPSLLLQSCCGPCSSYVLERLVPSFSVTLLYYNPNIRPEAEYIKRLVTQRELLKNYPEVKELCCEYEGEKFEEAVRGLEKEPEGGARCTECFKLRLDETARIAAEKGFEWIGTTLTVSPHKNAELINAIGEETAKRRNVKWLPSDFKKKNGYLRSIELSKELGLYRQDYCGCGYGE